MQRDPLNFSFFNDLLAVAMLGSLLVSASAKAEVTSPLDLATIPLSNSPTVSIQPNLLFIMDDSGSMAWDFMPDDPVRELDNVSTCAAAIGEGSTTEKTQLGGGLTELLCKDSSFNMVAYNPEIRYLPPAYFTSAGLNTTTYPTQSGQTTASGASSDSKPNWRQVKNNAYDKLPSATCSLGTGSTQCTNLENQSYFYQTVPGEYCTRRDLKVCIAQSVPSATHPYPAPLRWCNSSTNANAATPTVNSCQATRQGSFTYLRMPKQRTATITVTTTSNNSNLVTGILVDGKQIMSAPANGANNNASGRTTTATNIAARINACTWAAVGNCTIAGYSATSSGSIITITGATGFSGLPNAPTASGSFAATRTAFVKTGTGKDIPGERFLVVISSGVNSYAFPGSASKALGRTDCAGATCTYDEEMTNYANWWAYYRTRIQTMKTAASLAFKDVGDDFRVGFMTLNSASSRSLDFGTFNTAHKAAWYTKLFTSPTSGGTPLRSALSRAGRIYANKDTVSGVFSDPIQYECQQNFSLLTTDGFWNGAGGYKVDGSGMTNQDGGSTPRPFYEGTKASNDSLADAAKYYFDTDLRDPDFGNCTGALGSNVCKSPAPSTANKKQKMVTMTLGMGLDGTLGYTADYKTDPEGDFAGLTSGAKNWPEPVADTLTVVDDLWHAAVNGSGTYFSAKNPTDLVNQLKDALASVAVKVGAGAAAATSTLNPVAGDNFGYVASYTTGLWTGNLEKRSIDTTTGGFGLSALSCVEDVLPTASCTSPSSIKGDGLGGYYCETPDVSEAEACEGGTWENYICKVPVAASCSGTLKSKVSDFSDTRTIYMSVGGSLATFSYDNLTAAQKTTFQSSFLAANLSQWSYLAETLTPGQLAATAGANLLNYVRGQKGYEETSSDPTKRLYRKRQAVLGDIVDSTPKFIGRPTFSYSDPGYANFKSAQDARSGTVYVGGNDGMLHAFDGETLQERWAYVPSMVIPNLWKLADTAYATKHVYYANGAPTISDICVSGCSGGSAVWKTILVAGLNGGGRGYYALDVTNPTSPSLLWEFDASDEPNLGFTYGNPIVTKDPDGKWVVLVTSGYNNIPDNSSFYDQEGVKFKPNNPAQFTGGDGKGYLFVLDAATGVKLRQITTGVGTPSLPSGLAKISAWADDPEINNTATYVYGGDLLGNFWRFDLTDNSVIKFASFGSAQPVTTTPELGQIRKKRVVFVGTGKYLEVSDLLTTDQQTLYGIKDDDLASTLGNPKGSLVQQTIVSDGADTRKSGSDNEVNWDTGLGWYVDFPDTGERQNVASELVLGTLLVPTTVPTASACQPAGYGWLNFLDYRTGRAVPDAEGMVSARSNAPIVGFNVVSIGGKPKVNIVTADDPNPELIDFIKFTGSGTGFQKTRAIWRELIRK